jgi:uncharacterized repeat protein (TIGR03803 family)
MKANRLVWVLLLIGMAAVRLPAQTLQTLYSFSGGTNGESPIAALTLGSDGNFYGTTFYGGIINTMYPSGPGTIFKITSNGTLTTLVSFSGTNGAFPGGALTLGNDGNFYGTTRNGGNNNSYPYGMGTVFKLTTNGVLTTLVSFDGTNGENPQAGLTLGGDGNFYGTTEQGGISGYGTVFKLTTNGDFTTLFSFAVTNGAEPEAGLTLGNDGNFYGTASGGYGGIVFKATTNDTLTTLASFTITDGTQPWGLTLGNDGNFYGTTRSGGNTNSMCPDGMGTIFKVMTNGTLTTLVSFAYTNGAYPWDALTLGNDGNFYGTTDVGGNTNIDNGWGAGSVFKVTPNGVLTTLVSFAETNGFGPVGGLILGNDGNFYGTTTQGGRHGYGTVFRLSLPPVVQPTLTLQFWSGYPLLSIYGTLGDTYTIEYTADLVVPNWTPILIVPNLSINPFQMIDPAGVGQPMRFYRAVQSQ